MNGFLGNDDLDAVDDLDTVDDLNTVAHTSTLAPSTIRSGRSKLSDNPKLSLCSDYIENIWNEKICADVFPSVTRQVISDLLDQAQRDLNLADVGE